MKRGEKINIVMADKLDEVSGKKTPSRSVKY